MKKNFTAKGSQEALEKASVKINLYLTKTKACFYFMPVMLSMNLQIVGMNAHSNFPTGPRNLWIIPLLANLRQGNP